MTSIERVLKTIAHEEPDRVPVGEWGIDHDHVSRIIGRHTYWRNRKDTMLALWDGRRDEVVQSMKEDYAALVDALDYDVVTVETVPPKGYRVEDPPRLVGEGVWQDSRGVRYQYAASNDSIQRVTPRQGKEELSQADVDQALRKAAPPDDSVYEVIDYFCERYRGKKAILCRSIDIYSCLLDPFGGDYDHGLMLTAVAPEEIQKLSGACLAYNQALIDHCAKKGVTIMMQGQDFGMNSGCIIRPDTIRKLFFPMMDQVNQRTEAAGMIPFYHCCGNIWDIMDDFAACGYRGYQSIQESAGMDNRRVKERYGNTLALWTGIQCETLVEGSAEDVEREVLSNLELLMPGGGFLFGSTNSVQYGAKTDHYLRALELVRRQGVYR